MAGRSLKASLEGIERAKRALNRSNLTQKALAQELGLARSTVTNFFRRIPVDRLNFEEISKRLSLEWQEIVDTPTGEPEQAAVEETASPNSDFVGREEAIADLDKLVNEGAKVILIQAEGGVGKTTFAWNWFERKGLEPLELRVGRTPLNIQSAEDWVRLMLQDYFKENPEGNFLTMLEQLRVKLQTQRIGVLIDNLEPALINGEFIEPHQSYYVELLTVLAHPSVQSITLVTSREQLYEHEVIRLATVRTYRLEPLKEKAWKEYFHNRNISINVDALTAMYQSYGGNAEAMYILTGDIHQQPWKGNLEAYWQQNRDDLLRHRSLKSLVKRQFNKLKEDNRQAYDLLCRLGFYPERDVPSVPNAWLRCLLWDVPEKRRQRVIDDLCDRSLVKVSDEEYYLHPVIRAEAVERLNFLPETNREYLISIKKQIDLFIVHDHDIQKALSWINQKFNRVSKCYKKAAFRAYYLGCFIQYIFDFIPYISDDKKYDYFEIAYLLEEEFLRLSGQYFQQKGYQEGKEAAYRGVKQIINQIKNIYEENLHCNLTEDFEEIYKRAIENYFEEGYIEYVNLLQNFNEEQETKDAEIIASIDFELRLKFNYEDERIEILKETGEFELIRNKMIQTFIKGYIEGGKRSQIEYNQKNLLTIEEYKNWLLKKYNNLKLMLVKSVKTDTLPPLLNESKINKSQLQEMRSLIRRKQNIIDEFQDVKNNFSGQVNNEQRNLLKQYYEINRLLVYCLDKTTDKVRSHIEDTLLLPMDEIGEIEKRRGIQ